MQREAQILEQRPIVGLAQILDVQHHVAAAAHLAEVHVRRLDQGRPFQPLDLVDGLLPRRRLLVQLAVMDAADVLLLLLDVLALRLPRLQLLLVALLPQPPVLLEVAGVRVDASAVQLEHLGDDAIEEIAIVADDQHGLGLLGEVLFQPARGVDVEMVARLVEEHDVGRGEQQLGEHEPALLAAAEGLDGPLDNPRGESRARRAPARRDDRRCRRRDGAAVR